jgi:hypothetical protein
MSADRGRQPHARAREQVSAAQQAAWDSPGCADPGMSCRHPILRHRFPTRLYRTKAPCRRMRWANPPARSRPAHHSGRPSENRRAGNAKPSRRTRRFRCPGRRRWRGSRSREGVRFSRFHADRRKPADCRRGPGPCCGHRSRADGSSSDRAGHCPHRCGPSRALSGEPVSRLRPGRQQRHRRPRLLPR